MATTNVKRSSRIIVIPPPLLLAPRPRLLARVQLAKPSGLQHLKYLWILVLIDAVRFIFKGVRLPGVTISKAKLEYFHLTLLQRQKSQRLHEIGAIVPPQGCDLLLEVLEGSVAIGDEDLFQWAGVYRPSVFDVRARSARRGRPTFQQVVARPRPHRVRKWILTARFREPALPLVVDIVSASSAREQLFDVLVPRQVSAAAVSRGFEVC